jgi:hypothetical protein
VACGVAASAGAVSWPARADAATSAGAACVARPTTGPAGVGGSATEDGSARRPSAGTAANGVGTAAAGPRSAANGSAAACRGSAADGVGTAAAGAGSAGPGSAAAGSGAVGCRSAAGAWERAISTPRAGVGGRGLTRTGRLDGDAGEPPSRMRVRRGLDGRFGPSCVGSIGTRETSTPWVLPTR